jgi:hypothetical protein
MLDDKIKCITDGKNYIPMTFNHEGLVYNKDKSTNCDRSKCKLLFCKKVHVDRKLLDEEVRANELLKGTSATKEEIEDDLYCRLFRANLGTFGGKRFVCYNEVFENINLIDKKYYLSADTVRAIFANQLNRAQRTP